MDGHIFKSIYAGLIVFDGFKKTTKLNGYGLGGGSGRSWGRVLNMIKM